MLIPLYRTTTLLAEPLLHAWLKYRQSRGKEDATRLSERWGHASRSRPNAPLIWIHCASVGESLAVLPLLQQLRQTHPGVTLLLTTGTVSSARMIAPRLPEGTIHQFAPIDAIRPIRRFLNHWQPDLCLLVESELWPNLVTETAKRGKLFLINARMSPDSFAGWQKKPGMARALLSPFTAIFAQSDIDAARYRDLGTHNTFNTGNLKYDARPLPYDPTQFEALQNAIGDRPVWLASSTHPGEERLIAEAHTQLRTHTPDLLTIIVPRHAPRGPEIVTALSHLPLASRSKGEPITPTTQIYLADTMGELGLFYRLSPISFIGGSLVPHGGQNPLEAARLGSALITGPHMFNFPDMMAHLRESHAIREVTTCAELVNNVQEILQNPVIRQTQIANALQTANQLGGALHRLTQALAPHLPTSPFTPGA